MQRLEVSGAVRPIYGSLGFKRLKCAVGSQTLTFLDITVYKMHVSLCSYCTIRIHSYIKNVSVWDPTAHFKRC